MRVIIEPDYDLVSKWAANYVTSKINTFQPDHNKPFILGLPTGSTPLGMYKELIILNQKGIVSFKNVITFNMDEYVSLPRESSQSYYSFMWDNFFSHTDIAEQNTNILNGNAPDLQTECDDYEDKIKLLGGINLFIGGTGINGHIAFNEPRSSFNSRTRIINLSSDTISANSRFFDNDIRKVPKAALTVGIATIMDAEEIMIIISGCSKAQALQKAIEEDINTKWPLSVIRGHAKSLIICDEDSTKQLDRNIVKFFKEKEANNLDPSNILKQ